MDNLNLAIAVQNFFKSKDSGESDLINKYFSEIVLARNKLATSKGETNYLTLQLNNVYKIPEDDYNAYLKNQDEFSNKFHPNLNQINDTPHFLSEIKPVEILGNQETFNLFNDYTTDQSLINKINFVPSDAEASFSYDQTSERYTIVTPDKVSQNQKLAMTIHELAHVITHHNSGNKISSAYESEKQATKLELETTKKISTEFYQANIREYLMCFANTEFQIDLFSKVQNDITDLYRQKIIKYLGTPTDKFTQSWINNKKITMKPLSDLPYAVAISNLI